LSSLSRQRKKKIPNLSTIACCISITFK
jgi:hypothetical protein